MTAASKAPGMFSRATPANREDLGTVMGVRRALVDAGLDEGRELFGFTRFEFSLIDLIGAVVNLTGGNHLTISTWTAAKADLTEVAEFVTSGAINTALWIIDESFKNRQPALCDLLRAKFGDNAIRVLRCHAKFALVKGGRFDALVLTSANLNRNSRLENFFVSTDPELVARYSDLVDEVFSVQSVSAGFDGHAAVKEALDAIAPKRRRRRIVASPWAKP